MTPRTPAEMQQDLEQAYRQQIASYEQVLQLTRSLPARFAAGEETDEILVQIQRLLDQVAQRDQQILPVRQQWKTLQQTPCPSLAETLKALEQTVVTLMSEIKTAEQAAEEAKARLIPQMNAETKRHRMVQAYTAARSDH